MTELNQESKQPTPEQQQAQKFNELHNHFLRRRGGDWFSQIFWGLLIILVGAMFLAQSLGLTPGMDWRAFLNHAWPVLIIFVGLSVLSRGGWFARLISAVLMLAVLAFLFLWFFSIPVRGRVGGRQFNFSPGSADVWQRTNNQ
ncbi:MAG: hypothetical protein KGJ93_01320 [Patescibacteria group bacterium]|nr:hypothetical protein [Patescibacteria group bacterium]